MLYDQLLMYASLFDIPKALNAVEQHAKKGKCLIQSIFYRKRLTFFSDEILEVISSNQELMHQLHSVVDKYLNKCGRRWVDLGDIFSFARLAM